MCKNVQAGRQIDRQAGSQAARQAGKQIGRPAKGQTGRSASRNTCRWSGRHAGGQEGAARRETSGFAHSHLLGAFTVQPPDRQTPARPTERLASQPTPSL